jgi:hypothetical protein
MEANDSRQPAWKRKLADSRFFRRAAAAAAQRVPPPKVTPRFLIGLVVLGLSYLMAWPAIALLGMIAARRGRPAILAAGGPIAYAASTVVFLLGGFLAGRDGLAYLRWWGYRAAARFRSRRLLPPGERAAPGGGKP